MHFFSLIGVYCTGLRGLLEPAAGGVGATSFSLPFREAPGGTLVVDGRETSKALSFLILIEGAYGFLTEMDDDGSGGDGRSFFTGATSSRMSSSSTSSIFFLLLGMALGNTFSFSIMDRWRCWFFSRSIARTSWRMSCEPSSTYGGGGASGVWLDGDSGILVFRFEGLEEGSERVSCALDCAPTLNLMVGREDDAIGWILSCLGASIEEILVNGAGPATILGGEEINRGKTLMTGSTTGGWDCSAASKVLLMIVHSISFNQHLRVT